MQPPGTSMPAPLAELKTNHSHTFFAEFSPLLAFLRTKEFMFEAEFKVNSPKYNDKTKYKDNSHGKSRPAETKANGIIVLDSWSH
eukprot:scaffold68645_cov29-Prasinocladus_malaysianus.AAC.1